jgi:prevent-host-death family protein
MRTVGLFEAKQKLSELVERAGKGERIGIARRGKLTALIIPAQPERSLKQISAGMEEIRKRSKKPRNVTTKSMIEERTNVTRFVSDASVALAWLVDTPVSPYAIQVQRILDAGARPVVPALWQLEMANGLAVASRRNDLNAQHVDKRLWFIEPMHAREIETDADPVSIRHTFSTVGAHQLSAYDAVYLDIARRGGLPLATLDLRLRAAAKKAGVELLQ